MSGDTGTDHLARLVKAVTAIGADLELAAMLRHLVEAGVELVDATYGALGVLSPDRSHLTQFITVGLDDAAVAAIGERPKGHGILGLLIVDPHPLRLPDLTQHPESFGFPPNHPPMASFLGVPVRVRGEIYGNLYLTDKRGGGEFTELDEELAMGLAVAAGVAIDNARLQEQVREIALLEDRERIARDLHDTVIQRLFATGLTLQGAARLAQRPEVVDRIQQAVDELDVTVREVRSSIFELHTPATRGVRRRLLEVGDEMSEALGFVPGFVFDGPVDATVSAEVESHLVAVVREGLANIARHAGAGVDTAEVTVTVGDGRLTLTIDDNGWGVEAAAPAQPSGGRGLGNLSGRAQELGGAFRITEREGGGTHLEWTVPC